MLHGVVLCTFKNNKQTTNVNDAFRWLCAWKVLKRWSNFESMKQQETRCKIFFLSLNREKKKSQPFCTVNLWIWALFASQEYLKSLSKSLGNIIYTVECGITISKTSATISCDPRIQPNMSQHATKYELEYDHMWATAYG